MHGLLVAAGDPDALRGAIAELLAGPGARTGDGGTRTRATSPEFDFDVIVRRLEDLYCELLAQRADAGMRRSEPEPRS